MLQHFYCFVFIELSSDPNLESLADAKSKMSRLAATPATTKKKIQKSKGSDSNTAGVIDEKTKHDEDVSPLSKSERKCEWAFVIYTPV